MATNERRRVPGGKKRQAQPKKTAPEVVYTPAREFNRSRLVLNVLTVFAVAFAIFLGLSIFFKVEQVVVSGNQKYSEWSVYEAAGIREGDSLLFFGQANTSSKIIDALPYVTAVRFEVQLPGRVTIIVEEAPVVYSIQDASGYWWLITSEGRVAERVDSAEAGRHTEIKGFDLDCSHWGEEQNIQLEIHGNEVLALFNLWEYAAEEYPNCRIGDTIGEWTCREIIVKDGCNDNAHSYLVLFTRPLEIDN
jgi:hypothetical protein